MINTKQTDGTNISFEQNIRGFKLTDTYRHEFETSPDTCHSETILNIFHFFLQFCSLLFFFFCVAIYSSKCHGTEQDVKL